MSQRDTISPMLLTLVLDDILKQLNWEYKGISIDGRYLNHLLFADDIVLISSYPNELKEIISDLKSASGKVGLTMNLTKTKILTQEQHQYLLEIK